MSNIPSFNFSGMGLKTDEQLNTALKADQPAAERFFKPGRHEVVVLKSEYTGTASDSTWGKFRIEYEGAGGKTIRDTVLVPFSDLSAYKTREGKSSMFPTRKIKAFIEALGEKVTIATLGDVLKSYFGKDNSLVGLNVTIDVGYEGIHTKYLGKKDGKVQVALVTKNDDVIEGTPAFSSDKEAVAWAENRTPPMPVQLFPRVTGYTRSSTPNKPRVDSNW